MITCALTREQQGRLHELLASDPGLAGGLRPLLAGDFGADARDLFLACLSRRLVAVSRMRAALLLALADAMRCASGGTHRATP